MYHSTKITLNLKIKYKKDMEGESISILVLLGLVRYQLDLKNLTLAWDNLHTGLAFLPPSNNFSLSVITQIVTLKIN